LGNIELEKTKTLNALTSYFPDYIQFDGSNYITHNKRLSIPTVIKNIALITAPNSDGQRDFQHELHNDASNFIFHVDEYLCQIQGNNAHSSILEQLDLIEKSTQKYDVVVIVRGGGSQTDLSSFDTYELALRTATYRTPILAGIGHERNVSILDLMCNSSLKTPTKVAAFICEHNQIFAAEINDLQNEILFYSNQLLVNCKDDLKRIGQKIIDTTASTIKNEHHKLEKASLIANLLSPNNVLARGYSIIRKDGNIITNSKNVVITDSIEIEFMNEKLVAIVTEKTNKI
jgi:exodeoxyribonuclease VII large subunit